MILDQKVLSRAINATLNYILVAFTILIFAWIILPSYRMAVVETYVGLTAFIIILLLAFFNPNFRITIRKLFVIILLTCVITFIVPAGFNFNIGFIPLLEYSIFALPAVLGAVFISEKKKWMILFLIIATAYMLFMVVQSTMHVLIEYPSAARDLAQGIDTPQLTEWRMANVGGFGFAYCAAAVGFLLFSLLVLKSNLILKVGYVVLFIYISIFIFLAQYTTLLVFYAVGIGFLIFRRIQSTAIKMILLIITMVIALSLQDIMYAVSDYCNANDLSALGHHFDDFGDALGGKDLRSSRRYLAIRALDIWLDSPIWGMPNCKIPSNINYLPVMEAHSGMASMLASTGIIGVAFTGMFFYSLWNMVRSALKHQNLSTLGFDISTLFMVVVFFINPIFNVSEISVTTFFLVPAVTYFLNIKNERKKTMAC